MRILSIILCLLIGLSFGAPKKTDAQIKEQRTALKKLETDLAKKRKELALLETEEKGVLNTISLLDQNLNQTRTYIQELSKSEILVPGTWILWTGKSGNARKSCANASGPCTKRAGAAKPKSCTAC